MSPSWSTPRDQALHTLSVPLTATIGAQWVGRSDRGVEIRLPWAPMVTDSATGGIDHRAVMTLLDHASGAAVYAAQDEPAPTATLDLRVGFFRGATPGQGITVRARAVDLAAHVAHIAAEALADDGTLLAQSTGAFIVGAHPGGGGGQGADLWRPARAFAPGDASLLGSFEAFLGTVRTGPLLAMPFADRLIGAVSLPALHGGAVASLLATAAHDLAVADGGRTGRLTAITVQYLRAGRAEATTAAAEFEKRGARSAVVAVSARQSHGTREIARAQCTFLADGG
jgi:acyl-coenzyme A thioesterase PaaI-like protein